MTPFQETKLHEIASRALKTWIEQQILETAEPPAGESCEDRVQCLVNKAIDWRRDYIASLTLARNFKSLADFDAAINNMEKQERTQDIQLHQAIKNACSATNVEDFNDAARDILSPFAVKTQKIFLGKIRLVCMYLHGAMTENEDFLHIRPNSHGNMTENLFTILKDQGHLDEWQQLISQLPQHNAQRYKQHINGAHPA